MEQNIKSKSKETGPRKNIVTDFLRRAVPVAEKPNGTFSLITSLIVFFFLKLTA